MIMQLPTYFQEHPVVFAALVAWIVVWKGFALYKAARRGEKVWYVALLVLNTVGILEILYIFLFSRSEKTTEQV